jgi:hypothetical protein
MWGGGGSSSVSSQVSYRCVNHAITQGVSAILGVGVQVAAGGGQQQCQQQVWGHVVAAAVVSAAGKLQMHTVCKRRSGGGWGVDRGG